MALSKNTVVTGVWELIYDRMADVKSVTLSDATTSTIQTYTGAFPDKDIDTKSKYPICVINSPELSWEEFTLTKKQVNGTFAVDIYTTKAETADLFIDAIIDSIETYRETLGNTHGMIFVNLESTDYDNVMRGKIKIHMRSCTFGFKYKFTKT
ncbi:unnamed protein product [marine sediment metagenome]|uniref:Uncharacterized protein n=1 Tax=marine sediment metagenome TaxID=412755 RepID=X0TVV9_9ZZZZ